MSLRILDVRTKVNNFVSKWQVIQYQCDRKIDFSDDKQHVVKIFSE